MPTTGYFNAASHGVPDPAVYNRVIEYLRCEAEIGPDGAARHWATQVRDVRQSAATLLGGQPDEIGFSATTTTAWLAMLSRMDLAGKRVLVAPHDWGDYYRALTLRGDVRVEVLPELSRDKPDLSAWTARFGDDVAALFVPMVTAVGGQRYPVEAIGALTRPEQMLYVVDSAQALGQMPLHVGRIGCDVFVSTGRKWLRGPRQVSMAWVKDGCAFTASDLEPADKNVALLLGLGVAIDHYLGVGAEVVQARILERSNQLRDWAQANGVPLVMGTTGSVSLALDAERGPDVTKALAEAGITAKLLDVSYFEPQARHSDKTVLRISPHVYTTDQDMDELLDLLGGLFSR